MKKTPDEKNELMLANVKATLAIEGLLMSEEEIETLRLYLKGDLTEGQVLKIIRTTGVERAKN